MTGRTLYVHAGGGKTGSSALQNFFENHASRLAALGIAYERRLGIRSDYEIASGNSVLLYEHLANPATRAEDLDRLVAGYFGECERAVCSSESLAELDAQAWARLVDSTTRSGIGLVVVFYVRNTIPYLLSAYDQLIKRHGGCDDFDTWAAAAEWQHARALQAIADAVPRASIRVLHFDRVRLRLIRSFLDVLGVGPEFEIEREDQTRQVNRSLTRAERDVLLVVNKALGAAYSTELSDRMIYENPGIPGDPVDYGAATEDALESRYRDAVNRINNTFFNGRLAVAVRPIEADLDLPAFASRARRGDATAIERRVLAWALEKLGAIQQETAETLLAAARAANRTRDAFPDLPADFDVLAYLLLNPDVLRAGIDPYRHFVEHGRAEGRDYTL